MARSAGFWKIVNSRWDRLAREYAHVDAGGKCRCQGCAGVAVEVVEFFFSRESSLALCATHAARAKGNKA